MEFNANWRMAHTKTLKRLETCDPSSGSGSVALKIRARVLIGTGDLVSDECHHSALEGLLILGLCCSPRSKKLISPWRVCATPECRNEPGASPKAVTLEVVLGCLAAPLNRR